MKDYFSRHARLFLTIGTILLVLNGIALIALPEAPVGGLFSAIPLLVMGFSLKNTPLVRLGSQSIEVKAGPFAAKKIVALGEIEGVDASHPKLIVLQTRQGPVRIPAHALEDYQRREILRALGG